MTPNSQNLLRSICGRRVLIVGDLMLDEYIWGTAERISPEAPVPVVRCERRTYAPGGAANVVANIAALGAIPIACGIIGDDGPGITLIETLEDLGADVSGVLRDPQRCTTLKTRVIAHNQQIVRLDHENEEPVSEEMHRQMDGFIRDQIDTTDGVLFSDYNKGVLADHYVASWTKLGREKSKTVAAGPKPDNLRAFAGATLLSFNRSEAHQSVKNLHIPATEDESSDEIEDIGRHLLRELQCDALTITRGSDGVSVFTADGNHLRVSGMPVQVFDVAGAGDTFLATMTLSLCTGADFEAAATIANAAAACVVRKVGVATTDPEEILRLLRSIS